MMLGLARHSLTIQKAFRKYEKLSHYHRAWLKLYLKKSTKKLRFHVCYILSIEQEILRNDFHSLLNLKKYIKKDKMGHAIR